MPKPPGSERLEATDHLEKQWQEPFGRLAGEGLKSHPLEQLEDEERAAVPGDSGVEDERQAGMPNARQGAGQAGERLRLVRAAAGSPGDQLDRHQLPRLGVARAQHRRLSTRPEDLLEAIALGELARLRHSV